jgi:hypothetical protein
MTGRLSACALPHGRGARGAGGRTIRSTTPIAGVGVDERLDAAAVFGPALASAGVRASDIGTLFVSSCLDDARCRAPLDVGPRSTRTRPAEAAVPVLLVIENAPSH